MLAPLTRGRYERKYQRLAADGAALRRRFIEVGHALGYRFDEHTQGDGYRLCSLYFDTPELQALQANADGDYFHLKFRVRAYAEGDELYYEIKYKLGDVIFKRRRALAGRTIEPELCRREFRTLVMQSGSASLVSAYVLRLIDRLEPQALVRYRRTALVGFPEERLCLDQELAFGPPLVDVRHWFGPLAQGDPALNILELKTPPHAVGRGFLAVGRLGVTDVARFSKYCEAVTWLHDDPAAYGANPYLRLRHRPADGRPPQGMPAATPSSSAGLSINNE